MAGMLPRDRVNRHLFRRQALHPAFRQPDPAAVALACAGIRASVSTTPYMSLLWRTDSFTAMDLDRALHVDRTLVRVPAPRGSHRLLAREQAAVALAASAPAADEHLTAWGVSEVEFRLLARTISAALAGRSLSFPELRAELPASASRPLWHRSEGTSTMLEAVVGALLLQGKLVALKEPGWDRHRPRAYDAGEREVPRAERLYRWEDLYPDLSPGELDPARARRRMAAEYLAAFGPVTREDLAYWTGWGRRTVAEVLHDLAADLVEVGVAGLPGGFLVAADDYFRLSRPVPEKDGPPAACLLPGGDGYTKGHNSSLRLVPEPWEESHARFRPALVVDGWVTGFWSYKEADRSIMVLVQTFDDPTPDVAAAIHAAAGKLGQFVGAGAGKDADVALERFTRPGA